MTRGSQYPPHINCRGSPTHPNASTILVMVSNCGLPPSDRDLTRPRYSGLFGYFGHALGAGGGVRVWIKSDASPVFATCSLQCAVFIAGADLRPVNYRMMAVGLAVKIKQEFFR